VSDCARLAQTLLETCPALHILATSRETLGVPGELAWRVPSLSLPDGKADDADAEAVRLFVERARKVMPDWTPSPPEYATVAAICRRLDGIPLAIELAAARVRSLSVKEIGARLGEDFGLLSGGGRTLLPRQQTLAATFDWGWQLLSAGERTLLSRLSVFAGGWTLEMAEVACSDGDSLHIDEFVDLLTVLVDKSLVVYHPSREGVEGRYCLLETVRQYADERLRESGCGKASRERHRDTFLAWAEEIEPNLWREEQSRWFHRLETEHDNLRAALEWCRSQGDTEEEIRLVAVLGRFWNTCGHLREGRARLDAALSRMTPQMRYRPCFTALLHAGWTAYSLYDYPAARGYYEQALALCREYGERKAMAAPLNYLAALAKGDEDYRSAEMLYEEALVICREFDSQSQLAAVLNNLAGLVARRKDYVAARTLLEESISCSIAAGTPQMHGLGLDSLSIIDFHQGRHEEAQAHCRASLRLFHEAGALVNIPGVLGHMALLAQVQACPESERAAVLLGAAAGLRDAEGVVQEHAREDRDLVAETKAALGADAFSAAFAVGLAMGLEQILDYALG
jgi:predicted ATPase